MISRGENSVRGWWGLRGRLWKRMTGKAETPPTLGHRPRGPGAFSLWRRHVTAGGEPRWQRMERGETSPLGAGLSKFHVMIISGRGPPFNLRGSFPFLPAQRPQSFLMLALRGECALQGGLATGPIPPGFLLPERCHVLTRCLGTGGPGAP